METLLKLIILITNVPLEEFLSANYARLTHGVEILAAVTGILLYRKYKETAAKYFIWFLIYVLCVEVLGNYTRYVENFEWLHPVKDQLKGSLIEKNRWWFTLFWGVGSALFYSFYFRIQLKNPVYKKIIRRGQLSFLLFSLIYIILNHNEFFTQSIPAITICGSFLVLTSVAFFFIELLKDEGALYFYKSLSFIVACTVFIWFLIMTPLVFYDIYFSKEDWNFVVLKWQIYLFANIFMYLTFTIALIWCRPRIQ